MHSSMVAALIRAVYLMFRACPELPGFGGFLLPAPGRLAPLPLCPCPAGAHCCPLPGLPEQLRPIKKSIPRPLGRGMLFQEVKA